MAQLIGDPLVGMLVVALIVLCIQHILIVKKNMTIKNLKNNKKDK